MISQLIYNGKNLREFGITIEHLPESVHPQRRGDAYRIAGRNGTRRREDGTFENYDQPYEVWFKDFAANRDVYQLSRDLAGFLLGSSDFCRLEDTYEPDVFRLACYAGPLNVEATLRRYGRATLFFDCRPERYLKSGEKAVSYQGDSSAVFSVLNPTPFEARPLLKFTDTAVQPDPVAQTLTMRENYIIDASGKLRDFSSVYPGGAVSEPVSCSGKQYAILTGDGYAFYDSSGETREGGYSKTGGWSNGATRTNYRIPIPSWAATVVVSRAHGRDAQVGLSLQDPRPNPGASACTINGVVIDLDFSEYDTIYLDCDRYDAYYADGSSANDKVAFSSTVMRYPTFPGLVPGVNSIIPAHGSNLSFELTPRWWTV